jgi:hypothetical protein
MDNDKKTLIFANIFAFLMLFTLAAGLYLLNDCCDRRNEKIRILAAQEEEKRLQLEAITKAQEDSVIEKRFAEKAPFYIVDDKVEFEGGLFIYFYEADYPKSVEQMKDNKFTKKNNILLKVRVFDPDIFAQLKEGVTYSSKEPPMMRIMESLKEIPSFAEKPEGT